jgi:hypothetical protein
MNVSLWEGHLGGARLGEITVAIDGGVQTHSQKIATG